MKVGFLISSNARFWQALDRLFESMEYIPADQIIVVIGESQVESETKTPRGITIRTDTHNSYDHTATIDAKIPDDWTHCFLLHDTMELTPESYGLIYAVNPEADATAAWNGQCNLMLVRREWLLNPEAQFHLGEFKNCSKGKAVQTEGWLWLNAPHREHYPNNTYRNIKEPTQVYGGAMRVTEFYNAVAIIKHKANWTGKAEHEWEVRL